MLMSSMSVTGLVLGGFLFLLVSLLLVLYSFLVQKKRKGYGSEIEGIFAVLYDTSVACCEFTHIIASRFFPGSLKEAILVACEELRREGWKEVRQETGHLFWEKGTLRVRLVCKAPALSDRWATY
jgi:hypothetical protein